MCLERNRHRQTADRVPDFSIEHMAEVFEWPPCGGNTWEAQDRPLCLGLKSPPDDFVLEISRIYSISGFVYVLIYFVFSRYVLSISMLFARYLMSHVQHFCSSGGHQRHHRCRDTNAGAGAKSHPRPIRSQLLETSTEGQQCCC